MKKIIAIICIAFAAAVLFAALGCGGSSSTTSGLSPSQVVDKYMQATIDKDADAAYALLSEADKANITLEQMREEAESEAMDFDFAYELGEETINGDEASVEVTLSIENPETGESEEFTDSINLVKENGEWKIYFGDSL